MRATAKMPVVLALAVLGLVIAAVPAPAQDTSDNMQIVREKIRADRKLFVAANMELTESEGKAFWPVYDAYVGDLEALGRQGLALIEDYARNYQSMTDQKAISLLVDYMNLESRRLQLQHEYLPKFRQAVPDIKVARYYQIENKIRAVVNYEMASKIPLVK